MANANQRLELAEEMLMHLIKGLPDDQRLINESVNDPAALKQSVHKLHGAIRYCGVPRLAKAIEKLESSLKQDDKEQVPILLNLLNGEITALIHWYRENPAVFDGSSSFDSRTP